MKRSSPLPVYEIGEMLFVVDIKRDCLFVKGDRESEIRFEDLKYEGIGYLVPEELFPGTFPGEYKWEYIPDKIKLDIEGVSIKYNIPQEQLKGKRDFDVLVDQEMYHERIINRKLPEIDIEGDRFTIDLRIDELRLTSEPTTKIDLEIWFNDWGETMRHEFFYNTETKQAVLIDETISEYPKNIHWVELPVPDKLDPVAIARSQGKDIKSYLISHPFEKELKAKKFPLSRTEVKDIVERNKATLRSAKNDSLLKKNRQSKDKGKGKHL